MKKHKKINEGFEDFIPDDYVPGEGEILTREELGLPSPEETEKILRRQGLLPPEPSEIAERLRLKRVAVNLEEQDVVFFKRQAMKNRVPYQGLIREAVRWYVQHVAGRRAAA